MKLGRAPNIFDKLYKGKIPARVISLCVTDSEEVQQGDPLFIVETPDGIEKIRTEVAGHVFMLPDPGDDLGKDDFCYSINLGGECITYADECPECGNTNYQSFDAEIWDKEGKVEFDCLYCQVGLTVENGNYQSDKAEKDTQFNEMFGNPFGEISEVSCLSCGHDFRVRFDKEKLANQRASVSCPECKKQFQMMDKHGHIVLRPASEANPQNQETESVSNKEKGMSFGKTISTIGKTLATIGKTVVVILVVMAIWAGLTHDDSELLERKKQEKLSAINNYQISDIYVGIYPNDPMGLSEEKYPVTAYKLIKVDGDIRYFNPSRLNYGSWDNFMRHYPPHAKVEFTDEIVSAPASKLESAASTTDKNMRRIVIYRSGGGAF
jgi:endogenous inhibitor of DNA gyrase (YacG/DUF329 family)